MGGSNAVNSLGTPVIAAMLRRRAVPPRHLTPPGPSAEQITTMVLAAAAAPDHGRLRPYRFLHIPAGARGALADAFAAAELAEDAAADAARIARAREKALAGPELLGVILRPRSGVPDIPVEEQIAAAGAALAQLLLAAEDLGFAAMAVSGERCRAVAVRQALGLAASESLLCFVAVGTAGKARPPRPDPDLADLLATWTPDQSTG